MIAVVALLVVIGVANSGERAVDETVPVRRRRPRPNSGRHRPRRPRSTTTTMVNEIGAYSGLRWMDIRDNARTTTLTVTARGAWTVTVGGLDMAPVAGGVATGNGDSVVFLASGSTKAKISNVGEGNFAVHVASAKTSRLDLAVNTIGGYDGTVPLAGPAIVQITSSGDWSITPS